MSVIFIKYGNILNVSAVKSADDLTLVNDLFYPPMKRGGLLKPKGARVFEYCFLNDPGSMSTFSLYIDFLLIFIPGVLSPDLIHLPWKFK